jgi:lipoate-protein ligase A
MDSQHLKLASLVLKRSGNLKIARELIRYASGAMGKQAVFDNLAKPFNKQESLPFFYYAAWAALFAKGEVSVEPSDDALPSNFRGMRNSLRRADREADMRIMNSWKNDGGKEWETLISKLKVTFKGKFEDLGTDLFARYFLTSHGQNKSTPKASRSEAGKMQNELFGGAWYRLSKDPSRFNNIAEAIHYLGNYIKRVYDPNSRHFTKREVIPGELKEKRYLVDLDQGETPYGTGLENIEDTNVTVLDELEIENGMDPVKAEKQLEALVDRALTGQVLKENKTYAIAKSMVDAKKDLFFLSATVWKMLGEDWAMTVAKRWDENIARDIMMTCSEVSSTKLAPMMINKYKFMNLSQLETFASFVDECMNADAVIFNPKVKVQVKKNKSVFSKKMRRHSKSVPQWVNLFLAVNKGFTYQGITINGELHSSAKRWGGSLAEVAENSIDPQEYMAVLWEKCNKYIPVKTMGLNKSKFVKTMMSYVDAYKKIREANPDMDVPQVTNLFKTKMKTYFKDSEENYPYAIVSIPMAEGVRMSLIHSVLPSDFEKELTTRNYVTCVSLLEKLFQIPQSIINAVRDMTSEFVVDDIIDIVEEEVKKSKTPSQISISKQGGRR